MKAKARRSRGSRDEASHPDSFSSPGWRRRGRGQGALARSYEGRTGVSVFPLSVHRYEPAGRVSSRDRESPEEQSGWPRDER